MGAYLLTGPAPSWRGQQTWQGDEQSKYIDKASELLGKVLDLKELRYQGASYESGHWFPLVAKMRAVTTCDQQYLRPDQIATPAQRDANIQIEAALVSLKKKKEKEKD